MNCLHDRFNPSIENMFATLKIEIFEFFLKDATKDLFLMTNCINEVNAFIADRLNGSTLV